MRLSELCYPCITIKTQAMAIRKSKEKIMMFYGSMTSAFSKASEACKSGGFKKIEPNESLHHIQARYNNFFTVGKIEISLTEVENGIKVHVVSTANVDNIWALFGSPNDKIMGQFIRNFE